jgi:hypothetical protein
MPEHKRVIAAVEQFISGLLQDPQYDYIVPIERKGTALVRSVLGDASAERWQRIVTLDAAEVVLRDAVGKSVLVLDDSVWRGRKVRDARERLNKLGEGTSVTVAACMSHRLAPPDCADIVYYAGLDDDSYGKTRDAVILHLQEKGSLLLDTEHIEVKVRVDDSVPDFFEVLAGWGDAAVRFVSSAGRLNCTILKNPEDVFARAGEVVPDFADVQSVVCKLRVISTPDDPRAFSLIPILYPSVRIGKSVRYKHPRMSWTEKVPTERLFQCVGLSMSAALAADALRTLSAAFGSGVSFDFQSAGRLDHLYTVFPELKRLELVAELELYKQGRQPSKPVRGTLDEPGNPNIMQLADFIMSSCYDRMKVEKYCVRKLAVPEILELGGLYGHTEARASAALDYLIDKADILPAVRTEERSDGLWQVRVFGPDGEVVFRKILRSAMLAGRGMEMKLAG